MGWVGGGEKRSSTIHRFIGESRGGAFNSHAPPPPPLLGQMRACPNRKMNMHVEHGPPPPFGLEVGVVLRKRNEIKKYV